MVIKLVEPSLKYEAQILEFIDEFEDIENGIEGTSRLAGMETVQAWINHLNENVNLRKDKNKIRAVQYLVINEENELIGMANIRMDLNEYLLNYGGHIGYSVKPTERRKGYGYEILNEIINKSKDLGIKELLLICNDDNIGSIKVIESNNGHLKDKIYDDEGIYIRRYLIDLTNNKNI